MDKQRWNRLYQRAVVALWRLPDARRAATRDRWLDWAARVTGKNTFFMPWQ